MLLSAEGENLARQLGDMAELRNIDAVFSANSARAIGTAKYIAEKNDVEINVANEINERPYANDFLIRDMGKPENRKYAETESEVLARFNAWFKNLLTQNYKRVAVCVHAKILRIYLKSLGYDLDFYERGYEIKHNGKTIYDENKIGNPLLIKLEFENGKMSKFENIVLDFALTKHPKWFSGK